MKTLQKSAKYPRGLLDRLWVGILNAEGEKQGKEEGKEKDNEIRELDLGYGVWIRKGTREEGGVAVSQVEVGAMADAERCRSC